MIDERLALLAVGLLKSRAIEDAQRAAIERQRAAEAEARRHAGRRGRDR